MNITIKETSAIDGVSGPTKKDKNREYINLFQQKDQVFSRLMGLIHDEHSNNFLAMASFTSQKKHYVSINHHTHIRELLKQPRLSNGELLGEGSQLKTIALAMGKYRMSKNRKDAKKKRSIIAELLSNSEQHIDLLLSTIQSEIKKWPYAHHATFEANTSLQNLTVAMYLRCIFDYRSEIQKIPRLIEQQIAILSQLFIDPKNQTEQRIDEFLCIRDTLATYLKQDQGLLSKTKYTDRLSSYIKDSKLQQSHEQAFATGLNGALMAGYLAPYPSLIAALYEVGKNSRYQGMIRSEQKEQAAKGVSINNYILSETTLLNAIAHEILRLHPSQALLFRSASTNLDINGFMIPKDSEIILNIYHSMRNPSVWEDPNNFYPERFIQNTDLYRMPFLAYASGPSNCTGQAFSRITLKSFLYCMTSTYQWSTQNNPSHIFDFALAYNQPLKVKLQEIGHD